MDVAWLIDALGERGLALTRREASQFTEMYTLLLYVAARHLHRMNRMLRRRVRAHLAFGNLFVFERRY